MLKRCLSMCETISLIQLLTWVSLSFPKKKKMRVIFLKCLFIVGLFNVSNIYALTENKPYCHASLFGFTQANRFECPCAANSKYIPKLSGVAACN